MVKMFKRVVTKRVPFQMPKTKQKTTPRRARRGKDGRQISPRHPNSAHYKKKNQKWLPAQLAQAFQLKRDNPWMTYAEISRRTDVPYTTVCERLSGRRGTGEGHCAGGKRTPRVLSRGNFKFKRVAVKASSG